MDTYAPTAADLAELDELDVISFPELTGNDRCDRDPSEAAVAQVELPSGMRLLFCGHHWRENYARLSVFPHSVPADEARPYTVGRGIELGAPAPRDAASAV